MSELDNNSDKNLENISTPAQNDYIIETPDKKNFFANIIDKLKRNNNTKLIGPANTGKPHTTNRSIGSLYAFGYFRSKLLAALKNAQNLFNFNKEPVPKATITPVSVGQALDNKTQENTKETKFLIPNAVKKVNRIVSTSPSIESAVIIAETETKGIIDNAKTAKDVELENESDLTEEIEVSTLNLDENFDKDSNNKNKDATSLEPTLQVEDINTPNKNQIIIPGKKDSSIKSTEPIKPKTDDREL